MILGRVAAGVVALVLSIGSDGALAQKSADTIRIGMAGAISALSTYHDSTPVSHFLAPALFDTLIAFDERANTYRPLLATSWTRIDPRTLEFEIRGDATWHDGTPVDVDDAVYTLDWLSDPATRLHLEYQWDWIDHVEKLSHTRLRLIAKRPTPYDLARLAMHIPILPEHKHGQLLSERPYFGRTPVGSGPYRFVSLDHNQATVTRNDTYRHGGTVKPMPKIANLEIRAGWTFEDRVPEWRAGQLDLLMDADPVLADRLARERGATVTAVAGYGMLVLSFEARRSEAASARPAADARVRTALALAIDRAALGAALPADGRAPKGLCWPEQAGCGAAPAPSPYDPAAARAMLAGIGKPIDLVLSAQGATPTFIAQKIATMWRAVGVAVRVETLSPEELYIRVRDRALDAAIYPWHAGTMPDVYDTIQTVFAPNFWDLHEDPVLHALALQSHGEIDDTARREIVRRLFVDNAANTYTLPVAPLPTLIVHTPDIAIDARGRLDAAGFNVFDLAWR